MLRIGHYRLLGAVGVGLVCCQLGIASASAVSPGASPAILPSVSPDVPTSRPAAARPVTEAILSRAAATAQVLPEAVAYYQRTFGVSAEVAKGRLASQLMGQGVQTTLEARYGDAVAGVSFDNADGRWVVDAGPSVPASGVAAVFARTGLTGTYRISRVAYTGSDVRVISGQVTSRLRSLVRRGLVAVTAGGGQVSVTVSTSATPADRTAVAAAARSVAGPSAAPIARYTAPGGLAAQVTSVKCSGIYCNTLLGGDGYFGAGHTCTMSWYGSVTVSGTTQPLMLTAGHCTLNLGGVGSTVQTYDLSKNVTFGYQYLGSFSSSGDWGYIDTISPPPAGLDPGLGRPYGGYINWNFNILDSLANYYGTGVPSNGTVVCHNGEGSVSYLGDGTQCGTAGGLTSVPVINNGTETTLGDMLQINSTEECDGDSGGPWDLASSRTAVAIQSAASIPTGGHCGTTAWATPVSTPIQAYAPWDLVLYGG